MCSHKLSERKTVVHRQSLSRHFVTTMRQRAFHVANQIQGAARRGLAACAVDYTRRRGIPRRGHAGSRGRVATPHTHNPERENHEEPLKTKASARPPLRCCSHWFPHRRPIARKPSPGTDGHSAAPMYLECSPAFQWLCDILACDAIALLGSRRADSSGPVIRLAPCAAVDPRVPDTAANRLTTPPLHSASAR